MPAVLLTIALSGVGILVGGAVIGALMMGSRLVFGQYGPHLLVSGLVLLLAMFAGYMRRRVRSDDGEPPMGC